MIEQHHELLEAARSEHVHFLAGHGRGQPAMIHLFAGKLETRTRHGNSQSEAVVQ